MKQCVCTADARFAAQLIVVSAVARFVSAQRKSASFLFSGRPLRLCPAEACFDTSSPPHSPHPLRHRLLPPPPFPQAAVLNPGLAGVAKRLQLTKLVP